ncbi:MAG: response regulator [Rhodomicrobiaceae bacterium]
MEQSAHPLSGLRFLIVEDEMLQALRLGEMLAEMGGTVSGTAFDYEEARKAVNETAFDCAVLDVNLNGTLSFPIADALTELGIPFVFCTAYADGLDAYPHAPDVWRVDKPVLPDDLRDAVLSTLQAAKP